jgi:hypothetical protein
VQNVERDGGAPIKPRARSRTSKKNYSFGCRCGLPVPNPATWWEIRFADEAALFLSAEQFWMAGNCPISALDRLVREFGLLVEDDMIRAPFPFSDSDCALVCRLLHTIMLSIADYDRRPSPWVGSC